MSEVELVSYLKRLAVLSEPSTYTFKLVETIDTIERLVKELAVEKGTADRALRQRDEAKESAAQFANSRDSWISACCTQEQRAEAAEAEVDSLRSQVAELRDGIEDMMRQRIDHQVQVAKLRAALVTARAVAREARREWDEAPMGMKAGKLLIALSGDLKKYRPDIDQFHEAIASVVVVKP